MDHTLTPAPWTPYSDEADHYSYVRCLSQGAVYEVVRVTHDKWCGQLADFVHEVIFMAEYDEEALTDILKKFDYDSLEAFVLEVNHADVDPKGFIRRPDGSIDREASPAWWIDYMLLASLMAEHFEGREMTAQAADALAKSIVEAGTPADPFCIHRTFLDQIISIPLTDTEIEAIYAVKEEQSRREYLRDEIADLDEDDDCFEGHDREALLENEDFLSVVQRHWYHYNGHGGDQQENLREAIKVTIHELFPAAETATEDNGGRPVDRPKDKPLGTAYAVTVIRQRADGLDTELYLSNYLVDVQQLLEPSEKVCKNLLRRIAADFLQTEEGKQAYAETCQDFNWGDMETYIPDDFLRRYGVNRMWGKKFSCCGSISFIVNQDEHLGDQVL